MATHDVFISYSSRDKATADAVCHGLEAEGVRCWIAPRDVTPGMDWQQSLLDAIAAAKAVVLVFTQHANESANVRKEVTAAFEGGAVVVPFRLEDVEPQGSLRYHLTGVHWLDALTPPLENHVRQLAATLKRLLESLGAARPAAIAPALPAAPPQPLLAPPPASAARAPAPTPPTSRGGSPPVWAWVAGAVTVVAVLGVTAVVLAGGGGPQPPTTPGEQAVAATGEKPPSRTTPAPVSDVATAPPVQSATLSPARAEALMMLRTPIENAPEFAGELQETAGATPLTAAGAATVTSAQLVNALSNHMAEVTLVDAVGCDDGHASIPSALCLAPQQEPGPALQQAGVDPDKPLVFFCHGPSCAWSHTMATRAAAAGYRNVFWYRGGLAAWSEAGGPTQPPTPLVGG